MDKYNKVRKIGEGAFGKADLVKRKQDSAQMVIKEINISRMSQKEREEARKEVAVLAQLNHPNIVAYRESFEERGNLYIVMDFCAGGDLYARINSQRGVLFSEDQILDWFVQMCLAVKHIHDRKILHRDIKSQNIFLNNKGIVQLGDFGIAKVLNSTVELARTCIGTPYYLSPEICENQPYNNKSDIWSLGCVLYEVATLKHAFEAGNMKNLVLKIIRGSYPPLSPKYSYELRNLVAQLFKRSPRDRPSVNTVLKKPLISQRIARFLTSEQLASEFSHTIMHGHKPARALPPPPKEALRPPSARNRPESDSPAEAAVKKYDPSKIYGVPVVRKSKENRASAGDLKKRPGSAGSRPASASGSRPGSAAGSRPSSSQDLLKKKQELMEKEKKRQDERKKAEELKKKEFERKHKELQEKQKISRINKAREEGWSSLINSLESDKSVKDVPLIKKEEAKAPQAEGQTPFIRAPAGPGGDYNAHAAAAARGRYDYYNEYLDKLQKDREIRQKQDAAPVKVAANMGAPAPRPLPGAPKPSPIWRQAPKVPEPLYQPGIQREQNQQEERAKLVNDFISRRKEAELNKCRGQAELFGPISSSQEKRKPPSSGPNGSNQQRPPPSAVSNRNKEEQEYLEKLRQIRQQNYNERRGLQAKMAAGMDQISAAEERKKTADALKKQAEDWAKVKRDHLEQKRQELMDQDRLRRENRQIMNRPPPVPGFKPSPAVPITNVINAIGGTPRMVPAAAPAAQGPAMTNVLGAIGVTPKMVEEDRTKTPIQKQRHEILKKLNQQGPPKDFEESQGSPRPKWGAKYEEIKFADYNDFELVRPKWGGPPALNLGLMALEETASQMDATSARDRVILNPDSVRRQWGQPGETVINALQGVPLAEQTMGSNNSDNSSGSSASTVDSPAITRAGSTVMVSKYSIAKGTITIFAQDDNDSQANAPEDVVQTEITSAANADTVPAKVVIQNQYIQFPEMEVEEASANIVNQLETVQKSVNQSETVQKSVNQSETVQKSVGQSETVQKSVGQSQICSSNKPPIPARKLDSADNPPPIPSKPLVFPKPVLLPQPDSPVKFAAASNCPVVVRSEGPGALFERVELDEYDKEEDQKHLDMAKPGDEAVMKEHFQGIDKHQSGLVMGITIGSFDIGHRELLRTCSEPDLACLYRTMNVDTSSKVRVKSLEDIAAETEELEENTDSIVINVKQAIKTADNVKDVDHGEDKLEDTEDVKANFSDVDDEDSELADLLSVRETMRSLLLDESDEDKKSKSLVKFSLSSSMEPETDTNNGGVEDTEDDDVKQDSYDDDDKDEQNNEDNDEDDVEEHNDSDDGIDAPDVGKFLSVDNENPQTPDDVHTESTSEFFHSDESDSDFNDGADMADYDLFGRLEESRAQLEHELGADKLKQVYRTIQDCQEDEDENIEEGARIAQQMLGEDKVHLYPKIFQLVMADSAFTDDNFC